MPSGFRRKPIPQREQAQLGIRWVITEIRVFRGYLAAGAPVGKYLADQLPLPLGIGAHFGSGGGSFRTMALSRHATTHLNMLHRFLDIDAKVEQVGRDDIVVRIG